MKYLVSLTILGLVALASLASPPDQQQPGSEPALSTPPVSICPLVEAAGRTTDVAVLSSIDGTGRLSGFSAGAETGSAAFETGGSGSTVVSASLVSAVGFAGGLVELPSDSTVSGVVVTGETSVASEACGASAPENAFIVGGSTASGARFNVQLINPYAGPAVAELSVFSESGIESHGRFGSVTVPALSSVTLEMAELIPGRERISVEVRPTRGSVLTYGHQTTEGRSALWRALQPSQDWWIPVPAGGGRQLVIGNPLNTEVEYQVDLYSTEFLEGYQTGSIPARGEVVIPIELETIDEVGLRVISTSPVVSTLKVDRSDGLAMTAGSPVDSTSWLLPGAEAPVGGSGSLTILNPGIEAVDVNIRGLGSASFNRTIPVEPGAAVDVPIVAADGYRIEATGGVVVAWSSTPGAGLDLAMGVPLTNE